MEDGLPSSKVYCVLQDHLGYIWFGTEAGISRFDGYEFKNYTLKDGLTDNDILHLLEDKKGNVWVNSMKRMCYYDRKNDRFVIPEVIKNRESETYTTFAITPDSLYRFIDKQEIFKIDSTLRFVEKIADYQNDTSELKGTPHFVTDSRQNTFMIHKDSLFYYQKDSIYYFNLLDHPKKDYRFNDVSLIENGRSILYPGKNHLIKINITTGKKTPIALSYIHNNYDKYHQDREGRIWVATPQNGLLKGRLEDNKIIIENTYLRGRLHNDLIEDDEGNIWIATLGNGVYFFSSDAYNIKNYGLEEGLESNNVLSLHSSGDKLYIGTNVNKIIIKEDEQFKNLKVHQYSNSINRILSIDESKGRLFIATDKGVFELNNDQSFRHYEVFGATKTMFFPDEDTLLIANSSYAIRVGLADIPKYLGTKQKRLAPPQLIQKGRQYALYEEEDGTIWLGTTDGLRTHKNGITRYWGTKDPTFRFSIKKIIRDKQGLFWIATHGNGLIVVKDSTHYITINKSNGLASDICNDILEDNGFFWIATNNGLSKINQFDWNKKAFDILNFDYFDGLASNEINAIVKHKNNIVLGTNKGLSIYDPQKMVKYSSKPLTHITGIKINEQDSALMHTYYLNYMDDIEISFVGISYESHKNIRYKYRLKGIDKQWVITNSRSARYINLPAGDYEFQVLAKDKFGNESTTAAAIKICVKKPFWQTYWFILLATLATLLTLFFIFSIYKTYTDKVVLESLVKQRTQELNQNIVALERSNKELAQFAYVASHDLKEPLRSMSGFLQLLERAAEEKLNEEEREYMDFVIKASHRMDSIIDDLLTYSKIDNVLQEKQTVDLSTILEIILLNLNHSIKEKNAIIDINQTFPTIQSNKFQMIQLFQNLISNGLKYNNSEQPRIDVRFKEVSNYYHFSIKDNGIGIKPEYQEKVFKIFQRLHRRTEYSGTGIGLSICKKIVESHNGKIWFESELGKGSTFFFTIEKF